MYIDDWNTFYQRARELFIVEPIRTRYVIRYRHTDGKFCVKVTDDKVCYQYQSDQQIDLRKLEALNNLMFLGMCQGPDAAAEEHPAEAAPAAAAAQQSGRGAGQQGKGQAGHRKNTRRRG